LWNAGFLNEVQSLMKQGFTEETPAMIAHGYREAMRFLKGEITEKEAKNLMERNTRRYAKRQRTWWRREKEMVWVSQ
jgi:tRNA dimethylallyltransferase